MTRHPDFHGIRGDLNCVKTYRKPKQDKWAAEKCFDFVVLLHFISIPKGPRTIGLEYSVGNHPTGWLASDTRTINMLLTEMKDGK